MTLIIGIISKEGVVVGSDGAATLGSLGQSTAVQPTKKLNILSNKIILGTSGPVGLGQKFKGEIEDIWEKKELSGKKCHEAMTLISQRLRKHIIPELEMAAIAQKTIGSAAHMAAISTTLIALPLDKEPCLFQFDQQGAAEQSNEDLPFASIGSGQAIADPFLGLIRRIFWKNGICPSINEAMFATIWTLTHAIKINPGGVADPIQITTLEKEGSGWVASEYSESQLLEHYEAVNAAEESLHSFRELMTSAKVAKPIPVPPIAKADSEAIVNQIYKRTELWARKLYLKLRY